MTGTCNSCHTGDLPSSGHITTTAQCDDCHKSTSSWLSSVSVDHGTLTGTCNSCHTGDLPSSGHVTTTAQCDDCHKIDEQLVIIGEVWITVVLTGTCNSCHTGDLPSSGHIIHDQPSATTATESTSSWLSSVNVDHGSFDRHLQLLPYRGLAVIRPLCNDCPV